MNYIMFHTIMQDVIKIIESKAVFAKTNMNNE